VSNVINKNWISGFWRRIFALIFDVLILVAIGYTLGHFFERVFVNIGGWGGYIGLSIALAYFGTMNSKLFCGQTIGKKILKIKVVNGENNTISFIRSCSRFLILSLPFFLNNNFTRVLINPEYTWMVSWTLCFGGILSLAYMYIFNIKTRQSIHDMVCKTYVVNSGSEKNEIQNIFFMHKIVVSLFFIVAASVCIYGNSFLSGSYFKDLNPVLEQVNSEISKETPSVKYVSIGNGVAKSESTSEKSQKVESFSNAEVHVKENIVGEKEFAQKIAELIIKNYPPSRDKDYIEVELSYGYDIFIYSKSVKEVYKFTPEEIMSHGNPAI
jgi:uncharacterized RDD family membrane protein YckC